MINEFKEKYHTLSDAVIYNIEYLPARFWEKGLDKQLSVVLDCLNHKTGSFEFIRLEFKNVKDFRYVEKWNTQNAVIFEALIGERTGNVIVDFFPIQVDGLGFLKEDPQSDFSVRSETFYFEVLDESQVTALKSK